MAESSFTTRAPGTGGNFVAGRFDPSLFDRIDRGFCVVDVLFGDDGEAYDYRFVEANAAFQLQTGLSDPVGRTARELVPDLEEHWYQRYGAVAITGETLRFDSPVAAIGRWFDVVAFRADDSLPDRVAVLFTDITRYRKAEEDLRRREQRYRSLFNSLDEGFCVLQMIFDDDGRPVDYRFLEMNPAFEKHTGLENAVGRTARELLPTLEDHWFEIYGRVATTREAIRFENGSEPMHRWFDVFAFPIDDPAEHRVALLFADATERKRSAAERERLLRDAQTARAEAESASAAKSQFLAMMSHELRTPLTGIIAYTDLLEGAVLGDVSDRQSQALSRIRSNSWHLVSIIEEILTLARVEAGKEEAHYQDTNLSEITAEVVRIVEPDAESRGLSLSLVAPEERVVVRTDPRKVRQILINLVGNAAKYTVEGRITVSIVPGDDGAVCVHVRDTGPGIADDQRERIFEPFTQVDSGDTRASSGTGLGLAISRRLARLIGGDVSLESSPGNGSIFTLRIPTRP